MRGRERIACAPPLGSSVWAPFAETRKRAPKSQHNPSAFERLAHKCSPRATKRRPKCHLNLTLGSLGPLWDPQGHHGPKMTPKGTKITSKSNENEPKMTTNPPNVGRHFGRVRTSVANPSHIHHKSVANPSQIHRKSIANPSQIRRKSITTPSHIHRKSVANPPQIRRKSITNPSQILHNSIAHPSQIHRKSVANPPQIHHRNHR